MLKPTAAYLAAMLSVFCIAGCNWVASAEQEDSSASKPVDTNGASSSVLTTPQRPAPRNAHRQVADPYFYTGVSLDEWDLAEWANSDPLTLESLRGQVVVVHFWTDDSQRSMQAMELLADEFRMRKVAFVGVYFSTGHLLENDWLDAQARARHWGVTFPLAYDRQWRTLTAWWLSRFDHLPKTPTMVLDREGQVAYLHPGPECFPTEDPIEKLCADDFQALRMAIARGLDGQLADSRPQR